MTTEMKTVWIPEELRPAMEAEIVAVDIRMQGGSIVRNVAYNRKRTLDGLIVGGWDGLRGTDLDFDKSNIRRIKRQSQLGRLPFVRATKDALEHPLR